MEFKIPTREECQEIVKNSEAFYVTETEVDGFKVELYDYRLASISDFVDNNAFELRGLCFVYNETKREWESNILLNKFFNVNQTIGWMYDDVRYKAVAGVQDKLDGSVISFVKFPNGEIKAKSKMSFTSDQAVMAQEVYNNCLGLRVFVQESLMRGFTPIFELVSPENQIVLEYQDTELVLLQIRDSVKGNYLNIYQYFYQYYGETYDDMMDNEIKPFFKLADRYASKFMTPPSLDSLLEMKETTEGIEGWIVTFEDGQMAKIKTDWYIQLHGLIGPDAFRENLLIETILEDNIDDVVAQLAEGTKKEMIIELTEKVQHNFNHQVMEYKKLRGEYYNVYQEDRKEFALQYSPGGKKPHPMFGLVMKNLNGKFTEIEKIAEGVAKQFILKRTSSLGDAKRYVASL